MVNLEADTFVELDLVGFFVFLSIVWMNGMGHIRRDEEGVQENLMERVQFDVLLLRCEKLIDSVHCLEQQSAASTLETLRSTFFMVEKANDIDE